MSRGPIRRFLFRITPFRVIVVGTTGTALASARKLQEWVDETHGMLKQPVGLLVDASKFLNQASFL